jgi:hypothetical protein
MVIIVTNEDRLGKTHVNIGIEPSPVEVDDSPTASPGGSPSADGVYVGGAAYASYRSPPCGE